MASTAEEERPAAVLPATTGEGASSNNEEDGDNAEQKQSQQQPQWTYASKPGESSMFRAVDAVLTARPDWRRTRSAVHYNLLLAERWSIPYARLGRAGALFTTLFCSQNTLS
jgi:hypothetical protein